MNLTVIISDVDTVWMKNPFEYMKQYPEADILTSSDYLTWSNTDEGLEDVRKAGSAYNIGIMMFSPKAHEFAKEWVDVIEADDNIWDQNAFNECAAFTLQYSPMGAIMKCCNTVRSCIAANLSAIGCLISTKVLHTTTPSACTRTSRNERCKVLLKHHSSNMQPGKKGHEDSGSGGPLGKEAPLPGQQWQASGWNFTNIHIR